MPRSSGYDGQTSKQRESLENALAALIRVEYLQPITRLRVCQARDKDGMDELLEPALGELDDMRALVLSAKIHFGVALARLVNM